MNKTNGLITALKNHDWETVASLYNGPKWQEQNPNYASNLEKYYNSYK